MKTWMYLPVLLGVSSFVFCTQSPPGAETAAGEETATVSTFNEHCPIMGGDVTDDGGTTEWDGKSIGFCCPGCIDKFEALSDEEKAEALASADESTDGHDHDHADHDHGTTADS